MKYKSFSERNCSLALTLDVIGEPWTLLIVREAFMGCWRFTSFLERLEISRNMLSARLGRLVDERIFARVPVEGAHHAYVLTPKGRALLPIVVAMTQWGDRYMPHPLGVRLQYVERTTRRPVAYVHVRSQQGRVLLAASVKAVPGPGRGPHGAARS